MQNIVIDISKRGVIPPVIVTEYDSMSRFFTLRLLNNGADYVPPENANYSVWYETNDSKGWYDTITLPDQSSRPAVVADGNVLTVEIAEQATTSSGELGVMITGDDGYQLTITDILTRSDDIPGYGGEEVENYYNVYITEIRENAARAENAADIAVAYGATVEVDEEAQQLNITHHSDTEGGVGWLFGSAVESSAEGSVAAFPDGANDVAVKSLVAEITPVQSGSGDPSPDNIRPISGRTGMTVTRSGKNLLKLPYRDTNGTRNGITFTTHADGSVTINGTASPAVSGTVFATAESDLPLNVGDTLYFSTGQAYNEDSAYMRLLYADNFSGIGRITRENFSLTLTEAMIERGFVLQIWVPNGVTVNNMTFKPMMSNASIEEWQSPTVTQTIPLTWESIAGTIYGGTLDVVSGVLTVDKYLLTCADIVTPNVGVYAYATNPNRWQIALQDNYMPSNEKMGESISDRFAYYEGAFSQWTDGTFRFSGIQSGGYRLVQFKWDGQPTTVEGLKAFLAENPIHFVIPLATPQTYQLTPTEVRTILGGNNIYTDAGAVSVEYVADTKLYIDNKVAELQALILEN